MTEDDIGSIYNYYRLDLKSQKQVSFIWLFGDSFGGGPFNVDVYLSDETADIDSGETHIKDSGVAPCATDQFADGIVVGCSGLGRYIHLVKSDLSKEMSFREVIVYEGDEEELG